MNEYKGNEFTAEELKKAKERCLADMEQMKREHEKTLKAIYQERERDYQAKMKRCEATVEKLTEMIERAEEREGKPV